MDAKQNISSSGLKEARIAAGLTQQELADQVYCIRQHISRIEQGKAVPSLPLARSICNVLGCTWDIFFDE